MHHILSKPPTLISIDGAAATGKSSTARALAEELKFLHVDTGAHFRIVCFHLLAKGIDPSDRMALEAGLDKFSTVTEIEGLSAILTINEQSLDDSALRTPEINNAVSKFASAASVRDFLLNYQRSLTTFAQEHHFEGMVVEGRDIGTVVFPKAHLKIFLHADEATRIARRETDGQEDPISQRDALDSTRKIAPLTCPEDAFKINTSLHSLEQVVTLLKEKVGNL